jgi:tRNA-binding EMAP/Myf-like protein
MNHFELFVERLMLSRQKVGVATIGTKHLFRGRREITIKRSKIRGEESFGMICAEAKSA